MEFGIFFATTEVNKVQKFNGVECGSNNLRQKAFADFANSGQFFSMSTVFIF